MPRPLRFLALLTAALMLPAGSASASLFTVTTTADSGGASLRAAVEAANVNPDGDTIRIQATGTIGLLSALPALAHDVEILGPGAGALTISRAAASDFRIFTVGAGVTVAIADLTIADGRAPFGGGILNQGSLTLNRVTVSGNEAFVSGGMEATAAGGGIYATGPLTVQESTISGNEAIAEGGTNSTTAQFGGLIATEQATIVASTISDNAVEAVGDSKVTAEAGGLTLMSGPATVDRSTISGNSATAGGGATLSTAEAGGLRSFGALTLTSTTITANSVTSAKAASAANLKLFGAHLVRDTIVSAPQGAASCGGTVTSGGFNLEDSFSCGFAQASDQIGVDPKLDPVLRDNGGPTQTHALLAGSPAVDKGNAFGAIVDQRGLPRPLDFPAIGDLEGGDGSDIGAFELQPLPASVVQPPAGTAIVALLASDRTPPNTRITKGPARLSSKRIARFHFVSSEQLSTFQCKVDRTSWRGCKSPHRRRVAAGTKHLFKVRAIDRFGNVDPTPARFGWRVKDLGR